MADELISRADMARELHVTERQITTLVKNGKLKDGTQFPSRVEGRERKFYRDRGFDWYIQHKQEEAVARATRGGTTAAPGAAPTGKDRLLAAQASMTEVKLARARGELVSLEAYREALGTVLGAIRGRVLALPGEYAPRLPGDMAMSVALLRAMMADLLEELRRACTAVAFELPAPAEVLQLPAPAPVAAVAAPEMPAASPAPAALVASV